MLYKLDIDILLHMLSEMHGGNYANVKFSNQ